MLRYWKHNISGAPHRVGFQGPAQHAGTDIDLGC